MRRYLVAGLAAMTLILSGCSASLEKQALEQPKLDITRFFNGPVTAHGMIQDWRGKIRRQFVAELEGEWESATSGTLTEHFVYDNGEKQTRVWKLTKTGADTWKGTAGDIVGEATGKEYGNALNLNYTMEVPVGDKTWKIAFDDYLFKQDDDLILNRAIMRKFGIPIGSLTVVMRRGDTTDVTE